MEFQVKKKIEIKDLETIFLEASCSGERFILERKDGIIVGIVPIEDVEVLEKIEELEPTLL